MAANGAKYKAINSANIDCDSKDNHNNFWESPIYTGYIKSIIPEIAMSVIFFLPYISDKYPANGSKTSSNEALPIDMYNAVK